MIYPHGAIIRTMLSFFAQVLFGHPPSFNKEQPQPSTKNTSVEPAPASHISHLSVCKSFHSNNHHIHNNHHHSHSHPNPRPSMTDHWYVVTFVWFVFPLWARFLKMKLALPSAKMILCSRVPNGAWFGIRAASFNPFFVCC